MVRTERELNRRREVADLLVLPRPAKACTMVQASAEKLEHTGPDEKERVVSVPQPEQLARMPELLLPKQKGTEPSLQGRAFVRWERVKVSESRTVARERGIRAGP